MSKDITRPEIIEPSDENLDRSLRPQKLAEFVGQTQVKENLQIFIQAARKRKEALEHLLFYSPPGLGKTTLAHVVARETRANLHVTTGPAIERAGDLASILTNLGEGDILFIDEVHRLNKVVEETIYPAIEDFHLDLVIGKGPAARTLRLNLPHFTLIGATTRIGLMSAPLRDRFGVIHRLEFYDERSLAQIVKKSAGILKVMIDEGAVLEIARRARGTPRVANRLLKRVRDYVQVKHDGVITRSRASEALALLNIDAGGLNSIDQQILKTIIEKFEGGPVGIETLSGVLSEDVGTLEEVAEPYLIQQGFIKKTARGRVATIAAYRYLNISPKQENQLF